MRLQSQEAEQFAVQNTWKAFVTKVILLLLHSWETVTYFAYCDLMAVYISHVHMCVSLYLCQTHCHLLTVYTLQAEKKSSSSKAVAPIKKQSMFASPEGVQGRVGVTGSGQGMTDYGQRKKHKFVPT